MKEHGHETETVLQIGAPPKRNECAYPYFFTAKLTHQIFHNIAIMACTSRKCCTFTAAQMLLDHAIAASPVPPLMGADEHCELRSGGPAILTPITPVVPVPPNPKA